MTNFKCPMCKTLWVGAKPTQKHKLWDESKHQTLVAGKSSCTCGIGEDGFILQ